MTITKLVTLPAAADRALANSRIRTSGLRKAGQKLQPQRPAAVAPAAG